MKAHDPYFIPAKQGKNRFWGYNGQRKLASLIRQPRAPR